jgi:hypothetical protein
MIRSDPKSERVLIDAMAAIAAKSCRGGSHCSDLYLSNVNKIKRNPCVHAIAREALVEIALLKVGKA